MRMAAGNLKELWIEDKHNKVQCNDARWICKLNTSILGEIGMSSQSRITNNNLSKALKKKYSGLKLLENDSKQ